MVEFFAGIGVGAILGVAAFLWFTMRYGDAIVEKWHPPKRDD
ncbi:MAG TPA: hypothetical protein VF188_00205 [Longimicrobiales bacterium]|jgi:gas vesicle protein